jgi:Lrp/AsnC family transcriptional regulator, leucine-responsive regulatory protein
MTKPELLSTTDARLLAILQADGRRSYADLGSDLGMAGPSAHERVKKLEARGVISGYAAHVDPVAVGYGITAFCWVTQAPGTVAADLTDDFAGIAEIEECHHISGEADYLLKVRARDTKDLERVIRRIQATRHVFSTETDVVFSTGFEHRPLPLAERALSADHDGVETAAGETAPSGAPYR